MAMPEQRPSHGTSGNAISRASAPWDWDLWQCHNWSLLSPTPTCVGDLWQCHNRPFRATNGNARTMGWNCD